MTDMKTTQKDRLGASIRACLNAKITDLSTASSTFVVSPVKGRITKCYAAIQNTISVADANITFELAGEEITDSAIVVASSAAAGSVHFSGPTLLNIIDEGEAIEIITDGGSTTACEAEVTVAIEPSR
jgi:hypothetical protein